MLGYDLWLCKVINIGVQYKGGFLPDIILLTQGYYHRETRLNAMNRFCICMYLQPLISPKRFDIFSPLTGGCSEGLGAFLFFFKQKHGSTYHNQNYPKTI